MSIHLPVLHDIEIKCPECSVDIQQTIKIEDVELINTYERGMGTEFQYDFTVEFRCPHCKSNFEINGEVWEYPEGAINLIQLS